MSTTTAPMALNLTPNKIVGYRIKPDWHSFNVVLVKLHGDGSKNAGKEYETTLAYCRGLDGAAGWIFAHALRTKAELSQEEIAAMDGSCADIRGLQSNVDAAKEEVFQAVADLQKRIDGLALSQKGLVMALGDATDELQAA